MEGSRLRLSGTGEGFATVVRTTLSGADSPRKVLNALQRIFPDAEVNELPAEPSFGSASNQAWSFENLSLATFLNQLHEQRILDTALDAMSLNMKGRPQPFTSDVWLQSLEKSLSLFLETAPSEVYLKSASSERAWAIGCRRLHGMLAGVKFLATLTTSVRWMKTASHLRGSDAVLQKGVHFPV